LVHTPGGGYSWHYFDLAARLITGSGPSAGLHVYAAHPELQMGPLAMLAAVPLRAIDPALSYVLAPALLTLTGPVLLAMLVRAREGAHGRISSTMLLLTGLFALPVWTEVTTHYAHLDDVLAMAFGLAALVSSRRNAPVMTGVLLAGAVDAKPWALGFCAVLLALTPRARVVAGLVAAAGIMVVWLPFLLADPGTLSLTHFTIDNVDDSSLRALGVSSSATPHGIDPPRRFSAPRQLPPLSDGAAGRSHCSWSWLSGCCWTRRPTPITARPWCWRQPRPTYSPVTDACRCGRQHVPVGTQPTSCCCRSHPLKDSASCELHSASPCGGRAHPAANRHEGCPR